MARETEAPHVSAFGNWVTGLILFIVLVLILGGAYLSITTSLWAIIPVVIGISIWWFGHTVLPPDPPTGGMLTCWEQPITNIGKYGGRVAIVVGGRTILAPYFPFYIDVVPFELTNEEKRFPMTIYSGGLKPDGTPLDPVPLQGYISLTLRPNTGDAIDYIQSGKMAKILPQIDDILLEKAKFYACQVNPERIVVESEVISGPLRREMDAVIQSKSFGVEVVKIQAKFDYSEEIIKALNQSAAEKYQRTGEFAEFDTDTAAAQHLQQKYATDPHRTDPVPSLERCIETIKTLRLIRDERVVRIETDGRVRSIILTDQQLNMGQRTRGGGN